MDSNGNPNVLSLKREKTDSIEELTLPPSTTTMWRQLPMSSLLINPTRTSRKFRELDRDDSSDEDRNSLTGGKYESSRIKIKTKVLRNYKKRNEKELTLCKGEKITIITSPDQSGMVFGYKRTPLKKKKKGLFPAENVQGYHEFWC